jgi:hypothetical protein
MWYVLGSSCQDLSECQEVAIGYVPARSGRRSDCGRASIAPLSRVADIVTEFCTAADLTLGQSPRTGERGQT